MSRLLKDVKKQSQKLLEDFTVKKVPFVDVKEIAENLGIRILDKPFADNPSLSGMLIRKTDQAIMAINEAQSKQRQRFTIAHEIGHFIFDKGKDVWVDEGIGSAQISYRMSPGSRSLYEEEEVRANKFAAALLMPEDWIRSSFENRKDDTDWINEDSLVGTLAEDYKVSMQAMFIRLLELDLIEREHLF